MTIAVTCLCGRSFTTRDDLQGRRVTCPVCGQAIHVPVRAELANFDPLMSAIPPTLTPAVAAGQSPGGLRLIVIGAAAGIGITLVVGALAIQIWSLSSRPSARPAAPDADGALQPTTVFTSGPPARPRALPPVIAPAIGDARDEPAAASPLPPVNTWSVHADPPARSIDWPADMKL